MKKTLIGIAMMAALLPATINAQNVVKSETCVNAECVTGQNGICVNDTCTQTYCKDTNARCDRQKHGDRHKHGDRKGKFDKRKDFDKKRNAGTCYNAFESINLTDAQKNKIAELEAARANSCRELRSQAKAARAKNDSTCRPNRENRKDIDRNYLKGVREVLTPDQYVTFLESYYLNSNDGPRNPRKLTTSTDRKVKGENNFIKAQRDGNKDLKADKKKRKK